MARTKGSMNTDKSAIITKEALEAYFREREAARSQTLATLRKGVLSAFFSFVAIMGTIGLTSYANNPNAYTMAAGTILMIVLSWIYR